MFEEYGDVLTAEEACEALRIGYNALYDLLKEDPTISFCFSTDPLQERDDNTILSSWAGR